MLNCEHTASLFKALSDPIRLQIVERLTQGERCACELLADLSIAQPTLSHHMKLLHNAKLVHVERRATWVYYALNLETVASLHALLKRLVDSTANSFGQQLTDGCCETKPHQDRLAGNAT